MPDLFTHLATSRIPAAFLRDRRLQAILVFGSFLPDVASKSLYWVAWANSDYLEPFHSLAGLLLLCYAVALFFEEPLRKPAFAALYGGSLLHLALDLVKDNIGTGSASLFYPFSTRGYELAWIDPENVIVLIPAAATVGLLVLWLERRFRRVPQ
jgi:membrane-bound metal-dependent hydrolase YbcI (DUF457 family)